jgi:hypothetical protein
MSDACVTDSFARAKEAWSGSIRSPYPDGGASSGSYPPVQSLRHGRGRCQSRTRVDGFQCSLGYFGLFCPQGSRPAAPYSLLTELKAKSPPEVIILREQHRPGPRHRTAVYVTGIDVPAGRPGRSVPRRSGRARRGCGRRLCRGWSLRRRHDIIWVIETQPGYAPLGTLLALRHRREKAFDAAAFTIGYFHANRIFRIVPLGPGRRCSEDQSNSKDQPDWPVHRTPLLNLAYFVDHGWRREVK